MNKRPDGGADSVLAAIVQSSQAAIISKTLDGVVTSWNDAAERMFGYSAAEMIGRPISIIASPRRPDEMSQILARIRRGERVERFDSERRHKDGTTIHVSISVSPIHDDSGAVVGASKIAFDISRQKLAEAQLVERSAQLDEFAHLLDLAPAMVCSLDGRILFWGRGMQSLYGWSAEEAIGRRAGELLSTLHPMPAQDIQAELLEAGEWQGELVQADRDGAVVTVASHWALHRDHDGKPVSILILDWDVTEAKRSQEMIAEREARLRSVLDTSPNAVITIDAMGIVQSFSDAAEKLFGYAAGEVIGRNVKMLMPSSHRDVHDAHLERYRRTGERRIIGIGRQVEAQKKDGSVFPMELAVGEVTLGEIRIFTGFIRDLSASVKLEHDLRQAQKMEAIGQLTGGIAHDFNNLLAVIAGNLEMLERRVTDADGRDILREAQEAAQLGAELGKRLLAFGRRQSLLPRPTDLSALAAGLVDLLRRTLGPTIDIATRLADRLPATMVDPGQVENALLNLAVNARDAMPKGGRLIIETGEREVDEDQVAAYAELTPGHYVTLSVTDTGSGMPPEVQRRAFEPFYTTKGPGAGSGLGLSMIYGFVKQSGGHVQLYSEVGHGTTVRLYLPAQAGGAVAAPADVAAAPRPKASETILVVEDDERVRRVSVRRLKELGYRVIEAENGPAGLRELQSGPPIDLLFTDIVMAGGMSGADLAHEARKRFPELRILFTSGFAEPGIVSGELMAVNSGWLGKPHTLAELDEALRDLLGRG
jgi:PAS domain S-box-containing protein